MRNFFRRLIVRNLDYSTRHHLHNRLHSLDLRFIGAVIAFVVIILLVINYA